MTDKTVYDAAVRAYAAAVNAELGNPPGYAAGLERLADHPAFRAAVAAGVAAGRRQAAEDLRQYALNYPPNVFPPDSDSRDAIGGTAMRHAYNNAARIAAGAPAEPVEEDTE